MPLVLATSSPTAPPVFTVADQSLEFGRLTLAGDGGTAPAASHTITGATISGGTDADHWQVASDGTFSPSATGVSEGLTASYSLTCSFASAIGTDGATITINTLANAYSYASDGDLTAILAIATATTAGKTFRGRSGTYVKATFAKDWASETTLTAHSGASVIFRGFDFDGTNLTISGIEIYKDTASFETLVLISGTGTTCKLSGCTLHSRYFDPSVDRASGTPAPNQCWLIATTTPRPASITVENCTLYDAYRGLNVAVTSVLVVTDNIIHTLASDGIVVSGPGSGTFPSVTINGNTITDLWSTYVDDHADAIQFLGGSGVTGDLTVSVTNNICAQTSVPAAAAAMQCIFSDNFEAGNYITGEISGNLCVSDAPGTIAINQAKALTLENNTVVRNDHTSGGTGLRQILIGTGGGTPATSGTHVLSNNVAEGYSIGGTPTLTNNVTLGSDGATVSYESAFTGSGGSFIPATAAAALTIFAIKPSGPLDVVPKIGAVGTGGIP